MLRPCSEAVNITEVWRLLGLRNHAEGHEDRGVMVEVCGMLMELSGATPGEMA